MGESPLPDGSDPAATWAKRGLPADMKDRLIVALDLRNVDEALEIVKTLDGVVSFFKVGLGLQFAPGVDRLIGSLVESNKKLFLDAKMFDIPETVGRAVETVARRGVSFVTVHGDEAIMRAAVKAKGSSDLKVFAVTVLTSLDDQALVEMGYAYTAKDLVTLRARKAVESGCDGIIASADDNPDQIRMLARSQHLLIATPGIRMPNAAGDDQKRVATPRQAIENGADYLVVGRPIVAQTDPREAARGIIEDMKQGARGL
jgi:orotidine-5'-phosphate decarboxylase